MTSFLFIVFKNFVINIYGTFSNSALSVELGFSYDNYPSYKRFALFLLILGIEFRWQKGVAEGKGLNL